MHTLNSIEIHDTSGPELEVLVGFIESVGRNLVQLFSGISVSRMGTGKLKFVRFAFCVYYH